MKDDADQAPASKCLRVETSPQRAGPQTAAHVASGLAAPAPVIHSDPSTTTQIVNSDPAAASPQPSIRPTVADFQQLHQLPWDVLSHLGDGAPLAAEEPVAGVFQCKQFLPMGALLNVGGRACVRRGIHTAELGRRNGASYAVS